ncbi:MAG: hypothetical protein WKG07_47975 [Hymenobacter sp.]
MLLDKIGGRASGSWSGRRLPLPTFSRLWKVLLFASVYCLLWLLLLAYATWRLATRRGAPAPVALPTPGRG